MENPFDVINNAIKNIETKNVLDNYFKQLSLLDQKSVNEFKDESFEMFYLLRDKFIEFYLKGGEVADSSYIQYIYDLARKFENIKPNDLLDEYLFQLSEIKEKMENSDIRKFYFLQLLFILELFQGNNIDKGAKEFLKDIFLMDLNYKDERIVAEILKFIDKNIDKKIFFEAVYENLENLNLYLKSKNRFFLDNLYILFDKYYDFEQNGYWEKIVQILIENSEKNIDMLKLASYIFENILHINITSEIFEKVYNVFAIEDTECDYERGGVAIIFDSLDEDEINSNMVKILKNLPKNAIKITLYSLKDFNKNISLQGFEQKKLNSFNDVSKSEVIVSTLFTSPLNFKIFKKNRRNILFVDYNFALSIENTKIFKYDFLTNEIENSKRFLKILKGL